MQGDEESLEVGRARDFIASLFFEKARMNNYIRLKEDSCNHLDTLPLGDTTEWMLHIVTHSRGYGMRHRGRLGMNGVHFVENDMV